MKGKIRNLQKIRFVTRKPDWLLYRMGKWDSRHGIGACQKKVTRYLKKMIALESNDVIRIESMLSPSRKKAALVLAEIQEQQRKLSANDSSKIEGDSVDAIRKRRKKEREQEDAKVSQINAIEELAALHEKIVSIDTIMDERINKVRNHTSSKIHAYIAGICAGKIKDFDFVAEDDNSARVIYKESHQVLDGRISEIVSVFRKGEVS